MNRVVIYRLDISEFNLGNMAERQAECGGCTLEECDLDKCHIVPKFTEAMQMHYPCGVVTVRVGLHHQGHPLFTATVVKKLPRVVLEDFIGRQQSSR